MEKVLHKRTPRSSPRNCTKEYREYEKILWPLAYYTTWQLQLRVHLNCIFAALYNLRSWPRKIWYLLIIKHVLKSDLKELRVSGIVVAGGGGGASQLDEQTLLSHFGSWIAVYYLRLRNGTVGWRSLVLLCWGKSLPLTFAFSKTKQTSWWFFSFTVLNHVLILVNQQWKIYKKGWLSGPGPDEHLEEWKSINGH